MRFAFNAIYILLLVILSPWVFWRIVFQQKNRRGWKQKLFGMVPVRKSQQPCAWIHAVSVGEVNLLRPFVDELRRQFPEFEIAVSTTTETGFDLALKLFPDNHVFFCPADFSWAVNSVLKRIRPTILLLTELELWPNLISVTRARGIPVALINGRISEKSYRGYCRAHFLFRPLFRRINLATVQVETYANRLARLGMPHDKIHVCGNIKFDRISNAGRTKDACRQLAELAGIEDEDFVFIAGSTQENEDRMALSVYKLLSNKHRHLKMILVPRHPDRCRRLAAIVREKGLDFVYRSELPANAKHSDSLVMIVDVIGELGRWWGLADAGYVGGSMGGRGGQNMIEPAAWGVPTCFGPDTDNFRDVVQLLLSNQAAVEVHDSHQLSEFISNVIENPVDARAMGQRAAALVSKQQGVSARSVSLLRGLLDRSELSDSKRAA